MTLQTDTLVRFGIGAAFVLSCGAVGCGAEAEEDELGVDAGAEEPRDEARRRASCAQESDCPAGLACVAGACQPCTEHGQCQSDVCDRSDATRRRPGVCVPEASVVYVDAGARPACEAGDGSRANPVCEIRSGIPLAIGARDAVRVYPGHYFPFAVSNRTVLVFGPGDGTAFVGEEDITAAARIDQGSNVVLDGLDYGVHVLTGVSCDDATLKVLRGSARGDFRGIRSTSCHLEVDQVRAEGAIQSGLVIAGAGRYRVTNSYFAGGDFQAVVFSGSATGTFAFDTVRGGGELSPGGIDCGTTPRVIRDSIVEGSVPAAGGAQTVGACIHRRVVVGSGDTRPDAGLIKLTPELDPDGRLLDTPANDACCIDRGARHLPRLDHDFFGTPRPQGSSNDIGAHELPQGELAPGE